MPTAPVTLPRARLLAALVGAIAALSVAPSWASAASCGHVVWHYRAAGDPTHYHAIFAGLDYHAGIYAHGLHCRDARYLVTDYARIGFAGALGRLDFHPSHSVDGFRCHRVRDGDDSGRDWCVRRTEHVYFSDSDGIFV